MDPTPTPSYPLNITDHDLLIRVDQKVSQLSSDITKTNDTLVARVTVMESKIIFYDQILAEYPPTKLVPIIMAHEKWISNWQLTWKTVLMQVAGISSLITGGIIFLSYILNILGFFQRR